MTPAGKLGFITLPLFLAESTTDSVKSSALGEWLVIGAAVLVIVQIGWNFIDRVRGGTAQKREVTFAAEAVSQDELRQTHGRISREREELNREIERLEKEQGEQRDRFEQEIGDLNERIDQVPERTIALLKNTKGLIT